MEAQSYFVPSSSQLRCRAITTRKDLLAQGQSRCTNFEHAQTLKNGGGAALTGNFMDTELFQEVHTDTLAFQRSGLGHALLISATGT